MKSLICIIFLLFCSCANEIRSIEQTNINPQTIEAGIIMAAIGPLQRVQMGPGERWLLFSGGDDVKIFPVKVGTQVQAEKYVFSQRISSVQGVVQRFGNNKDSPLISITRPGLYFYSTTLIKDGKYMIVNQPNWEIISAAKAKYPQYFEVMDCVNFNMEDLQYQYFQNKINWEKK